MSLTGKQITRRQVDAKAQAELKGLHPVLARVFAARRIRHVDEVDCALSRLLPPSLSGLDRAADLLAAAVQNNERLLIVADFDADGATSCALGMRALRSMGAADVHYVVPNRFEYGYGLTPEIVALAADRQPDLLITVDNGISSLDGVRAAQARGIKVLITDHHLPGDELPPADAIVNPNQPGDTFASKHLAGVGVIFYVMSALRARLRSEGWFERQGIPEPNLAALLDLVALGTVADVVPLDQNNRVLVAQGLKRINAGRCCAGIKALCRVAGKTTQGIVAMGLGFIIAPRLNAAGRLEDMSLGIECLLTDDPQVAEEMAVRLDALNRERRVIESQMQEQALAALDAVDLQDGALPLGLCLFQESWHQGVIGLVAARIKERLHRPVIAFAPAAGQEIKGSARSVPGLHIRDALDAVAARHPTLLQKFGGHAMAAGLSLERSQFEAFSAAFDAEVRRHLHEDDLQQKLLSDGELDETDLALELALHLRHAGPWGQGFPAPVFDGRFEVLEKRIVGGRHVKLLLRSPRSRKVIDAIVFSRHVDDGNDIAAGIEIGSLAHAAYTLDVNEYQGCRSLQLIVEQILPVTAEVSA